MSATKAHWPTAPGFASMLRLLARALSTLYGVFALVLFFALLCLAAILALIVPSLAWRRSVTHSLARLALRVLGLEVSVIGLQNLPDGSCIVAANHSSYLDGIVLKAMLPPRFSFVIKREASRMPVAGFLMRRIGSEFVDRNSSGGRQRDARRVIKRAEQGHSLVFFPEGTFDEHVGLKRFHIGAFAAAVRGGMPVVPVIIHGARRAFPNRAIIVRPGRIVVEILEPLPAAGVVASAEVLRDETRQRILERLDEPDLAAGLRASRDTPES
ncbi:MAG: 1-acyl-sn-glycerol-3-phosphate acyltransferase [Gammaproteobacteria bacterium]|nr:1-acyl-sn-glycerol-3-phosphate acyltransferase [Gammaproteobacteria bacterium]